MCAPHLLYPQIIHISQKYLQVSTIYEESLNKTQRFACLRSRAEGDSEIGVGCSRAGPERTFTALVIGVGVSIRARILCYKKINGKFDYLGLKHVLK